MSASKDELLLRVDFAQQTERYQDMAQIMKQIIESGASLSSEERDLFSVAYKNLATPLRTGYQLMSEVAQKTEKEAKKDAANKYRDSIGNQVRDLCAEVLALINTHLMPKAEDAETRVYYLKLTGDYYRYMAEVTDSAVCAESMEKAWNAYRQAYDLSKTSLAGNHYVRVGLALNYSVFLYEMQGQKEIAIAMAREAGDQAGLNVNADVAKLLKTIRTNLEVWKNDEGNEGDSPQPAADHKP